MAKVGFILDPSTPKDQMTGNLAAGLNIITAGLMNMGYEIDVISRYFDDSAYWGDLTTNFADYDFVVSMHAWLSSAYQCKTILNGSSPCPVFWMGSIQNTTNPYNTLHGVTLTLTALYRWVNLAGVGDFAVRSYYFSDTGATAITRLATNLDDQTKFTAYVYTAGSAPVYVDCLATYNGYSLLLYYMQDAINRGAMPPPPRKLPFLVDQDDAPSKNNHLSDIQGLINAQNSAGLKITWGYSQGSDDDKDAGVNQLIASEMPKGLIHIVDHGDLGGVTTWYDAKSDIDDGWQTEKAYFESKGIGDYISDYRMFNQNEVGLTGLELMTPLNSVRSDPDETTAQTGYGYKAFRVAVTSTVPSANTPITTRSNHGITTILGMMAFPIIYAMAGDDTGRNIAYEDTTDTNANAASDVGKFTAGCLGGAFQPSMILGVRAIHAANIFDGTDNRVDAASGITGNAPGYKLLSIWGNVVGFCSSVLYSAWPAEVADQYRLPEKYPDEI